MPDYRIPKNNLVLASSRVARRRDRLQRLAGRAGSMATVGGGPAYVIPPDDHALNDAGHVATHNEMADVLGLYGRALAQLASGGGAQDPGGNAGNLAAIQAMLSTNLMVAAPTATEGVFKMADTSYLALPQSGDNGIPINAAIGYLPIGANGYRVGTVQLLNGAYNYQTGLVPGPYVKLKGVPSGTVLKYTGSGKAIFAQDTTPQDTTYTAYRVSGAIEDIVLDISGAGSAASGIYLDSTNGYTLDNCAVLGYNLGSTQRGVVVANDTHSLNSLYGYCHIRDCGTGLTFTQSGTGSQAQERIDCKWKINTQNGQTGISVLNGMQVQSSDIRVHVNADQYANCAFNFGYDSVNGPTSFTDCHFVCRVEPPGTGTSHWSNPTVVAAKFAALTSGWKDCTGILFVSSAMPSSASAGPVGSVVWGGVLNGDAGLSAAQSKPHGWL